MNKIGLPIFLDPAKHNVDKLNDYSPYHFASSMDRLNESERRSEPRMHVQVSGNAGDDDDPAFEDSYSEDE
jgi:hypothetical protein